MRNLILASALASSCALALGAWYYEAPKIGCGQIRSLGEGAPSGAYYCHIIVIPR